MTQLLALAWGVLTGGIVFVAADRSAVRRLARGRKPRRARNAWPANAWRRIPTVRGVATVARVIAAPRRARGRRRREDALRSELPIAVDLLLVATSAGATPYQSVELAIPWAPNRIGRVFDAIHRTCALGASFDTALERAGRNEPVVLPLTRALRTATELGSPVTTALARCAADVRSDVRRRAESHARTVPVRLLFPLVLCLLPAFALLTVVPVLLDSAAI